MDLARSSLDLPLDLARSSLPLVSWSLLGEDTNGHKSRPSEAPDTDRERTPFVQILGINNGRVWMNNEFYQDKVFMEEVGRRGDAGDPEPPTVRGLLPTA